MIDKKCADCREHEQQISFISEIRIPYLWSQCPPIERRQCALRPYLAKNKVFTWSPSEHIMIPYNTCDWPTARDEIDRIYALCAKCVAENKEK